MRPATASEGAATQRVWEQAAGSHLWLRFFSLETPGAAAPSLVCKAREPEVHGAQAAGWVLPVLPEDPLCALGWGAHRELPSSPRWL